MKLCSSILQQTEWAYVKTGVQLMRDEDNWNEESGRGGREGGGLFVRKSWKLEKGKCSLSCWFFCSTSVFTNLLLQAQDLQR